jgi:hypothetical protein
MVKNLKEIIHECECKHNKRLIPFLIYGVFGAQSQIALLDGNYKTAIIEGLVSLGALGYCLRKEKKREKQRDRVSDSYNTKSKDNSSA